MRAARLTPFTPSPAIAHNLFAAFRSTGKTGWLSALALVLLFLPASLPAQEPFHVTHKYRNVDARSLIGLPMGDHKTIVEQDGRLRWSQWSLARKGPDVSFGFSNQLDGELGIQLSASQGGEAAVPLTASGQELDNGRYPFVITHLQGGTLKVDETAFPVSVGGRGLDVVLFNARNDGDKEATLELRLSGKQRNLPAHVDGARLATREGLFVAVVEPAIAAQDSSTEAQGLVLVQRRKIPARGSVTFWVKLPYELPVAKATEIPAADASRLLAQARQSWDELWARGLQLELPGHVKELSDFYLSSLAYVLILTERDGKGELWALDGPAEYREFWGRGEYFQSRAIAVGGHVPIAGETVQHTFSLQKDDGEWTWPVTSGWPAWDNIGGNAGAVWDYYKFTQDRQWLAKAYPFLARAADWITRHREETMLPADAPKAAQPIQRPVPSKCMDEPEPVLQPGEKPYWWGLLPWGYGDSGLPSGHPFPHNMWALFAIQTAERAARELGNTEDAARFARQYEDYKAAILTSMERAIKLEKEDAPYLPAMPTYPDGGVSQSLIGVYPTDLFAADHPWVTNLLKRMQRTELHNLPTMMAWMGKAGVWPGESMNVAEIYLRRGDIDKTISLLYSALEHSHTTKVWREEIKVDKTLPPACTTGNAGKVENGYGTGDMPEAWANANLVVLVRDMLIREDRDVLYLLSGIPGTWIKPGEHIAINSAPTTFGGKVSYRLDYPQAGRMKLHMDTAVSLPSVSVRFPLAAGQKLKSVTVNGKKLANFEASTVALKDVAGATDVEVAF